MIMTDCVGCDPDLVYHERWCRLAGELRGTLWLRDERPSEQEDVKDLIADAYERGRFIEQARAESRIALGLPLSREPQE